MITNANRTNADGCAGINQVADLQRKETADISDNLIYGKQHICCVSLLYSFSVHIQMERQLIDVSCFFQRNEGPDNGRVIECLADFPRQALLTQTTLQIPGCKIDTDSNFTIVPMSKTLGNILP